MQQVPHFRFLFFYVPDKEMLARFTAIAIVISPCVTPHLVSQDIAESRMIKLKKASKPEGPGEVKELRTSEPLKNREIQPLFSPQHHPTFICDGSSSKQRTEKRQRRCLLIFSDCVRKASVASAWICNTASLSLREFKGRTVETAPERRR